MTGRIEQDITLSHSEMPYNFVKKYGGRKNRVLIDFFVKLGGYPRYILKEWERKGMY